MHWDPSSSFTKYTWTETILDIAPGGVLRKLLLALTVGLGRAHRPSYKTITKGARPRFTTLRGKYEAQLTVSASS